MKRFSQRSPHRTLSEINVTPLLDLAFVLLIIFMITTPLLEKSIDMSIPTSDTASQSIDPQKVHTIEIDKAGRTFFEKERVDLPELERRLKILKASDRDTAVLLRGDQVVKLQDMVTVIDSVQKAGITRFGIVTQPAH